MAPPSTRRWPEIDDLVVYAAEELGVSPAEVELKADHEEARLGQWADLPAPLGPEPGATRRAVD